MDYDTAIMATCLLRSFTNAVHLSSKSVATELFTCSTSISWPWSHVAVTGASRARVGGGFKVRISGG